MNFVKKAGYTSWLLLAGASRTLAQGQTGSGGQTGGSGQTGSGSITISLSNPLKCGDAICVVQSVLSALFKISIPIVSLMILIGAFQIMTAAGNPEKVSAGRKTIIYAVVGFAIVLLASSATYIISDILGTN